MLLKISDIKKNIKILFFLFCSKETIKDNKLKDNVNSWKRKISIPVNLQIFSIRWYKIGLNGLASI